MDSYKESGRKVVEIFKAWGWSSVVTSHLMEYVLGCTTWTIGIVNRLLSIITEIGVNYSYRRNGYSMSFVFGQVIKPQWWSFGLVMWWYYCVSLLWLCWLNCANLSRIGFLVGIVVSSIMISVVRGEVHTLIICHADTPGKLEDNHPEEMATMSKGCLFAYSQGTVSHVSKFSVVV